MENKKKLLTIGQFAALHGINKKTLMWYDEIGLFHPSLIHPENGYRYYSYYQSAILETIQHGASEGDSENAVLPLSEYADIIDDGLIGNQHRTEERAQFSYCRHPSGHCV